MIRVKILRTVNLPGLGLDGDVGGVGVVLSLPDRDAEALIARQRAIAVLDLPEGGAPVPEHRDPAPTRTRRR